METKYVFIINASLTTNILSRFDSSDFTGVSVIVEENDHIPRFEYPTYSISLLDTAPAGSVILTIKYKSHQTNKVEFFIDQMSNSKINNYISLQQSLQTISLVIISSPIINDKPDLSFSINMKSINKLNESLIATTKVHIDLLTSFTVTNFPKFQQPYMPNEQIFIELNNLKNNSIIYQFKADNANTQSMIEYQIVNHVKSTLFYINENNLHILLPQKDKKKNYLVSLEAVVLFNPKLLMIKNRLKKRIKLF